jgi:hypothetical protein
MMSLFTDDQKTQVACIRRFELGTPQVITELMGTDLTPFAITFSVLPNFEPDPIDATLFAA